MPSLKLKPVMAAPVFLASSLFFFWTSRRCCSSSKVRRLTFEELQQRREVQKKNNDEAKKTGAAITGFNFKEGIASVASAEEIGDYYQYIIDQKISVARQKSAML